jgi:spoIIIJ-associated protein
MNKQEFNGKTLDEALASAARAFGTDVTLLSYNILPQASGGLLSKLFQRGVRLEAWVDNKNDVQAAAREAVRQAMAATPESTDRPQPRERNQNNRERQPKRNDRDTRNNRASARPGRDGRGDAPQNAGGQRNQQGRRNAAQNPARAQTSDRSADELQAERANRPRSALTSEESKGLLIELAHQFARGFDPGVEPNPQLQFLNEEEVIVTVNAPNLEELLIRSDRLSCAFEHLFKRIAQKRFGDVSGRVALNSGRAAQEREDKLRATALDVANKVKENGKTITLSSKSSQERRVIHLALENMEGIATKSVGVGDNRKLIIYSTNRPPRSADDSQPRENRSRHGDRARGAAGQPRWNNNQPNSTEGGQQPRRSRRRGRRGSGANRQGARPDGVQGQNTDSQSPEHEGGLPPLNT